jgi:orotidine-5'-phosphate decarboxylase
VGAVVGATYPAELAALRQALPEAPFLVPAFGVQGGKAADVAPAFRSDGLGAIISSSRGILFPCALTGSHWEQHIEAACRQTIAAIQGSGVRGQGSGKADQG